MCSSWTVSWDSPGDVVFIESENSSTNIAAQWVKNKFSGSNREFFSFSHVALSLGVGEVIHSTTSNLKHRANQEGKSGILLETIHDLGLLDGQTKKWDVLRAPSEFIDCPGIRSAALGYVGFAYNNRFDFKELVDNKSYNFAVYCSEFVAQVFAHAKLGLDLPPPHKTTPSDLFSALKEAGWDSVKSTYEKELASEDERIIELVRERVSTNSSLLNYSVGSALEVYGDLAMVTALFGQIEGFKSNTFAGLKPYIEYLNVHVLGRPLSLRLRELGVALLTVLDQDQVNNESNSGIDFDTTEELDANKLFKLEKMIIAEYAKDSFREVKQSRAVKFFNRYVEIEVNVVAEIAVSARLLTDEKKHTVTSCRDYYSKCMAMLHDFGGLNDSDAITSLSDYIKEHMHGEESPSNEPPYGKAIHLYLSIRVFYNLMFDVLHDCSSHVVNPEMPSPDLKEKFKRIWDKFGPIHQCIDPKTKLGESDKLLIDGSYKVVV